MLTNLTRAIAFGAAALCFSGAAHAQSEKPIRIILPYAAGGMIDAVPRVIMEKYTQLYGQHAVIEARPGANGNIATEYVAKAPADGYTWLISATAMSANPWLYAGKLNWNLQRDFAGVAGLVWVPPVFAVPASVPASTLKEFVAYAKANPGLPFANSSTGSSYHLSAVLFMQLADIDMTAIGYKGIGQALPDLLRGEIKFAALASGLTHAHVKSGKLKVLAVLSKSRLKDLPSVPTLIEEGYPEATVVPWYMFVTAAGAPKDVVARFNSQLNKTLAAPDVKERLEKIGGEVMAPMKPAEVDALLRSDYDRWGQVIRRAGIKAE
jgi:tripartite-type tricarboxylate transporter receptor subunit TctC